MKDNYHIDLDIGRAYLLHEYLNRHHISNRLYPVKDGVAIPEPEFSGDWSKYADAWRIEYDDVVNRTILKTIKQWLRMRDKGLQYCPFCGGMCAVREHGGFNFLGPELKTYQVICLECGGSGPEVDNEQDAIDAWNSRF